MMDSDDPDYGLHSAVGSGEESEVEIIESSHASQAVETEANAAGWITEGPPANWEVAYVYAFLYKFTNLVSVDSPDSLLSSVTDLETALLESSPVLNEQDSGPAHDSVLRTDVVAPAPVKPTRNGSVSSLSSLDSDPPHDSEGPASRDTSMTLPTSDAPARSRSTPLKPIYADDSTSNLIDSQPTPPSSPLILDILFKFQEHLLELIPVKPEEKGKRKLNKKGWQNFLLDFVDARLIEVYRGGLRWDRNYLALAVTKHKPSIKETETQFWKLSWEDKIHLFRILVDFQLTNCPSIRAQIAPKQQPGGNAPARLKECVISPLGTIGVGKKEKVVWQIDDSPRLYVCHDPYTADSAFETATATVKQYKKLMRSLPKSTVVSNGKKSAKPVAFAAMFANVPTTKDKGEGKDVKAGNANEVALRRALKIRLDDVVEFDNARKEVNDQREQVREAKRQEQLRLEQQNLLKATRIAEARARSMRAAEKPAAVEEVVQYNGARSSRLQKMKLPTYVEPTERGLGYGGEPDYDEEEVVVHVRSRSTRAGKPAYEDDEEDYSETIAEDVAEEPEEPEDEQAFEPETQEEEDVPSKKVVTKKQRTIVESADESSAGEDSAVDDESEEEVVAPKKITKKRPPQILDSDDDEFRVKPSTKKQRSKAKKDESDLSSVSDLTDEEDLLPAYDEKPPRKGKGKLDNFIVPDSEEEAGSASESGGSE